MFVQPVGQHGGGWQLAGGAACWAPGEGSRHGPPSTAPSLYCALSLLRREALTLLRREALMLLRPALRCAAQEFLQQQGGVPAPTAPPSGEVPAHLQALFQQMQS